MSALDVIKELLIGRPDGNVSGTLRLAGAANAYSIYQFSISFSQDIDEFGEPQSESVGGQMLITLAQLPDNIIMQWAGGARMRKNGEIRFKNETESTTMRIDFENAYCTSLRIDVDGGSSCSFAISPEKVSLNGELLDNNWV